MPHPPLWLFLPFLAFPLLAVEPGLDRYIDDLAATWMRADPQGASQRQYFRGAEQDALDRELTPVSTAWFRDRIARARSGLAGLQKFDRSRMSPQQRLSVDVIAWQLDAVIREEPFLDYRFPLDQMRGLQSDLPNFLSQLHGIRSRRDAENYLARLKRAATTMDEAVAGTREREARGKIAPKFILMASIGQMERFLDPPPSGNLLVTSFAERLAKVQGMSDGDRKDFTATAAAEVEASIYPAWRRALATLRAQAPKSTDDTGLWRFPDGDRAYADALRRYTTTSMTAAQVHQLGLSEVARIEGQMDGLLRQLGYTAGSVKERYSKLQSDTAYRESPGIREKILAEFTSYIRDAERRSAALFDRKPVAPVEVRRIPEFRERNSPAHYTMPAPDGSRPGIFWAQLVGPTFPVTGMRTLAYHEAVPGHHFHNALQAEDKELPRFRRENVFGFLSAFGEGWALYAERLAIENGWYEGDPRSLLGALDAELFRARRLVADTGLHTMKWTRQQAIDYGLPAHEVERYIMWPGQACSYKIGQLKILELRDRFQRARGDRFSLQEFHAIVLRTGSVPLDLLERVIDEAIRDATRP